MIFEPKFKLNPRGKILEHETVLILEFYSFSRKFFILFNQTFLKSPNFFFEKSPVNSSYDSLKIANSEIFESYLYLYLINGLKWFRSDFSSYFFSKLIGNLGWHKTVNNFRCVSKVTASECFFDFKKWVRKNHVQFDSVTLYITIQDIFEKH